MFLNKGNKLGQSSEYTPKLDHRGPVIFTPMKLGDEMWDDIMTQITIVISLQALLESGEEHHSG